jgi:hypothetical protein
MNILSWNDDLPGPVERARIATPNFRPVKYEPPTRPTLLPTPSPHQFLGSV